MKNVKKIFALSVVIVLVLGVVLPTKAGAVTGSIAMTVAGTANSAVAGEINSMSIAIYDGTTYLNPPNGEYIPSVNFSGSQSYGFNVGNVSLNDSNVYKIAVALFSANQNLNYSIYSVSVNGSNLTRQSSDSGIFIGDIVGSRVGNTVQYTVTLTRSPQDSINITIAGANNPEIANELGAISVGVFENNSYLNGPNGEYIQSNKFSGSEGYGFSIGGLTLNNSNIYTIGVGLFGGSVDFNLYEVKANGLTLSRLSDPATFSAAVPGSRNGNTLTYNLSVKRNAPATPPPASSPPPTVNVLRGGAGSVSTVDTTPKNPKIVINDGAEFTTSTAVVLKPDATGPRATMLMKIANTSDFLKIADWEPYKETKSWNLEDGYGTKTVYIQFQDFYGNLSVVATGTIKLVEKLPGKIIATSTDTTSTVTSTPGNIVGEGEVLGISRFNFIKDLEFGLKNDDVKQLQLYLSDKGYYKGEVTGYFGLETLYAVKSLQRAKGITPTGIVGPLTRKELNKNNLAQTQKEISEDKIVLRAGMKNEEVSSLQSNLTDLGIYSGPITGYFGAQTEAAVKNYQSKNNLSITGAVNEETLNSIKTAGEAALKEKTLAENRVQNELKEKLLKTKANLLETLNLLLIRLRAEQYGLR